MKIISLLPAATEIICALGLENQLYGRSHLCSYPESIRQLPVCTSEPTGPGAGISAGAEPLAAVSAYTIHLQQIKDIAPDIIITRVRHELQETERYALEHMLAAALGKPVQLVNVRFDLLPDIAAGIRYIATVLGVPQSGEILAEGLEERIEIIKHKLKFVDKKPAVACIKQLVPLATAAAGIADLVEAAGGHTLPEASGQLAESLLLADDPDIIMVMPRDYAVERSLREIGTLLDLPGWSNLKAVKNNQVFIVSGQLQYTPLGLHTADHIELLAEIINPRQFAFGYEGAVWLRFGLS